MIYNALPCDTILLTLKNIRVSGKCQTQHDKMGGFTCNKSEFIVFVLKYFVLLHCVEQKDLAWLAWLGAIVSLAALLGIGLCLLLLTTGFALYVALFNK